MRDGKIKKLNLGCGEDIRRGYLNLDFDKRPGVDVIWDIEKFPWPFENDEFDFVYASHLLEHVDDLVRTMNEIKRICKNDAIITIRLPHFSCGVSYRDPTHKRFISYHTFDYFTKNCFYKHMPIFEISHRQLNFTRQSFTFLNYFFNPLINLFPTIYERFFCWMLPCSEALFKLRVIKNEN